MPHVILSYSEGSLLITIKFYMQYLVVSDRNADMAALMILVAVETADIPE